MIMAVESVESMRYRCIVWLLAILLDMSRFGIVLLFVYATIGVALVEYLLGCGRVWLFVAKEIEKYGDDREWDQWHEPTVSHPHACRKCVHGELLYRF
jgi:hypothetical protein